MVLAVCPECKRISLVFGDSERRGECYPVLLFGQNGSKDIVNHCRHRTLGYHRAGRFGQFQTRSKRTFIGKGNGAIHACGGRGDDEFLQHAIPGHYNRGANAGFNQLCRVIKTGGAAEVDSRRSLLRTVNGQSQRTRKQLELCQRGRGVRSGTKECRHCCGIESAKIQLARHLRFTGECGEIQHRGGVLNRRAAEVRLYLIRTGK